MADNCICTANIAACIAEHALRASRIDISTFARVLIRTNMGAENAHFGHVCGIS